MKATEQYYIQRIAALEAQIAELTAPEPCLHLHYRITRYTTLGLTIKTCHDCTKVFDTAFDSDGEQA